jgi:hypothetical protein
MFRWISILSFAAVFAGIVLHHLLFPCGYKPRFSIGSIVRKKVHLFTLLFPEQKLRWPGKIQKCAFVIGLFCFIVLLMTGFGPLFFGGRLHGYLLMVHVTFAAVFIACAAVVAVLGAGEYAFSGKDAVTLSGRGLETKVKGCWLMDSGIGAKAGFWFLLLMSLPVTMTMVLSMFPIFGTEGQKILFHAHRWCALIFAVTAMLQVYILIRTEILKDMK